MACPPIETTDDAGLVDAGQLAVTPPAPPASPAAATLTPCPDGWHERSGLVTVCEPWVNDTPDECAAGFAHFPGAAGCERVGPACPVGAWPLSLPDAGSVLFVSATATTGGDGSSAAPFQTLTEALASSTSGPRVIALSKGTHVFSGLVPADTTIVGACAEQTRIAPPSPNPRRVALLVRTPHFELRNVQLVGPEIALQVQTTAATAHVEDVIIDGATGYGWSVFDGARATGKNVVIRNTAPFDGVAGRGVSVANGASLTLSRAMLIANSEAGIHIIGPGTKATLSDVGVLRTKVNATGSMGNGIHVSEQAEAELTRVMVRDNRNEGVTSFDAASITMRDVVVLNTLPRSDGRFGDGIAAHNATIVGARLRSEGHSHSAIVSTGTQATVVVDDVVASHTHADRDFIGTGLLAVNRARLTATRALVFANETIGCATDGEGNLTLTDVDVVDTTGLSVPRANGAVYGNGIASMDQSHITATRVRVHRARSAAVGVFNARFDAHDLIVTETLSGDSDQSIGISAIEGSQVSLSRVSVEASHNDAIWLEHSAVEGTDLAVRRAGVSGGSGVGIAVRGGATLTAERVLVEDCRVFGVVVESRDSRMTAGDLVIRGTREGSCAPSCADATARSVGVLVNTEAQASVQRFLITDNQRIGVAQSFGASLDLAHGEVSFHEVGVMVMDSTFDANRLANDVIFHDNAQKLSTDTVPLPTLPERSVLRPPL